MYLLKGGKNPCRNFHLIFFLKIQKNIKIEDKREEKMGKNSLIV